MGRIYGNDNNGMDSIAGCETISSSGNMERKFVNEIVDLVVDALSIQFNEIRIVRPLLTKVLNEKIDNHYPEKEWGLLQQYQAYILDEASKRIIGIMGLKSGVNHDHALHAKFADITRELRDMVPIPVKQKE